MRKILLTAAFAALTLASSVSANWITGEPTILAVNSGEAAFHTALTGDQRLDVLGRNRDDPNPDEPTPADKRDGGAGQDPYPILLFILIRFEDLDF